jgi:flagellin-specific chaperone FliS
MKKILIILIFICSVSVQKADAQIVELIKAAITKVVRAVDLQVQRLQTQTIWLQDAQKIIENTMHQLKLTDIANWSDKQKTLYANYYNELWQVKNLIGTYQKVKDIIQKQTQLVNAYKQADALFKQDSHFNINEMDYMERVYSGIIDESVKNLEQVYLVINSFSTQMSDAQRLAIVNAASGRIDENYNDLKQFNNQNVKLSLQRSKDMNDMNTVKQLYGLPPNP